jgi:hypothetical protein
VSTAVRPRTPLMLEADWKSRVLDAAKLFGWRYAHFRPARTAQGWRTAFEGHAGFPDLVLLRPPRLLLVELKRDGKQPTDEQAEWLQQFSRVPGVEAYCWRPAMWQDVYLTLAKESQP